MSQAPKIMIKAQKLGIWKQQPTMDFYLPFGAQAAIHVFKPLL